MTFNPDWFVDRLNQFQRFQEMLASERPETLMLIKAGEMKGKTWLLRRMEQHCAQELPPVQSVYIEFADPRFNAVDDLGIILLLRDRLGAPEHFEPLDAEIGRHVGDPGRVFARPMQFLADEMMTVFFEEEDLKRLARLAGVYYDQLPGDSMSEKAFELINYSRERNELQQLLADLIREREHKSDDWTRLVDDIMRARDSEAPHGPVKLGARLSATGDERERILHAITRVFVACLTDYLSGVTRLVLLIDSYQEGSRDAKSWLEDNFQLYLTDEALIKGLILIVAGRQTMYVSEPAVEDLIVRDEEHEQDPLTHGLLPFSPEFIAEYSRKRQVDAEWARPERLEKDIGGDPGDLAFWYDLQTKRGRR